MNYCRLDEFLTIDIRGENAKTFLQSHLTANFEEEKAIYPAALCNQKGRIIATTWLIKKTDSDYQCLIHKPLLNAFIKKLNKTAPLSRVLIKESTSLSTLGIYDADAKTINKDATMRNLIHLSENLAIAIFENDNEREAFIQKNENATEIKKSDFHQQRLKTHWFLLDEKSSKAFLPNRLGLLENDTVSVKKGCYIGHEIIARLHFRTEEKYQIIISDKALNLNPTDKVFLNEKDIGEVIEKIGNDNTNVLYALSLKKDKIDAFNNQ